MLEFQTIVFFSLWGPTFIFFFILLWFQWEKWTARPNQGEVSLCVPNMNIFSSESEKKKRIQTHSLSHSHYCFYIVKMCNGAFTDGTVILEAPQVHTLWFSTVNKHDVVLTVIAATGMFLFDFFFVKPTHTFTCLLVALRERREVWPGKVYFRPLP